MKNYNINYLFTVFIVLVLGNQISAQVLWHGDPDLTVNQNFRRLDPDGNRNPSGSRCVDDPNNRPFVTTPIDPEFGKFWRITKPTSRKRAEFARTTGTRNSFVPQKGGIYYYGWRWRINSTPNLNNGIAVFQWKTDQKGDINTNKQNYPFSMAYNGAVLSLIAHGPAEPNWNRPGSISVRKTTLWSTSVQENKWVSIVIKVKVDDTFDTANNRYNGYIEFWFNGVKQTLSNSGFNQYKVVLANSNTTAYHRTFDGGEVYPKWGSYNENACNLEILTDYDDMKIAATLEEALPENASDDPEPEGLEGTYKIKHSVTGKYWTVANSNIITADEITPSSASQIFEIKLVGTSGYYNISSLDANWNAVRFHDGNVYPTSASVPTSDTNNTRIFQFVANGSDTYDIHTPQTTTGRYAYDDSGNVRYLTSSGGQTKWVLENQTLSLDKTKLANKFRIYPNPVINTLSISAINIKVDKIEVFNLSGKKLITKIINNNQIKLDVSSIATGIYFVKVYSHRNIEIIKMIKY